MSPARPSVGKDETELMGKDTALQQSMWTNVHPTVVRYKT